MSLSLQDNINKDKVIKTMFNDWLNYKGTLYENENLLNMLFDRTNDIQLKGKIRKLYQDKRNLAKLYQTIQVSNKHKNTIEQLRRDISDLEHELSREIEIFKKAQNLKNLEYHEIALGLHDDELYIDFAKTSDAYYYFTLDNHGNITYNMIEKNKFDMINSDINNLQRHIQKIVRQKQKNSTYHIYMKKTLNVLNELDKLIISKNFALLIKNKNKLIISPDGILNFLPFEALFDKQKNKYFIETKEIRYVPSGKEFIRLLRNQHSKAREPLTLFGNPDFNADNIVENKNKRQLTTRSGTVTSLFKLHFSKLPATQKEVDDIKRKFQYNISYEQQNASETNLYKIKSPAILHFATHGFFINDKSIPNPMLKSGIALSGANIGRQRGTGTGIVTALKLSGLQLQGTELVVLSACKTGLGDIVDGQGISGLNKAFIQAGAKSVVMTLWSIADKESAALIKEFYHNIDQQKKRGKVVNYSAALRAAKLKMIHKRVHPYFWSGFIISGI